ncbi:hypothetical protein IMCC9480_1821 [Oxalobacteraceae bacterium IMCC9480]|nr:hypothetical protein IMCC9480_1821 [Oxalobacteraceae bacterium IMCC9480]
MRQRLHPLRVLRPQTDPYRNRYPDQRGQRNEQHHACERDESQADHVRRFAPADIAVHEGHQPVHRRQRQQHDGHVPRAGNRLASRFRAHRRCLRDRAQTEPAQRAAHGAPEPAGQFAYPQAAPAPVEQPRALGAIALRFFETELVGPGQQRAEKQLVVGHDAEQHRTDCIGNRAAVFGFDGHRDVGTDAGQFDVLTTDRNRLGRDQEEPATRHRHHHVPQQARHCERQFQPPETLPAGQPEYPCRFAQFRRHGAHRLVQAERHVPCLRREDREDGSAFDAEQVTGKKQDEGRDRDGLKTEDGHRLQDVEHRHHDFFSGAVLHGDGGKRKTEQQRTGQRREHAQHRA